MKLKTAVMLAVVALFALAAGGCNGKQSLYSGLTQREANEMLAVLKRAGIDASIAQDARGGTLTVSVGQDRLPDAVDVLSRAGLPAQHSTLQEVLPRDTWMVSPSEERARLAFAVSQELTTTLTKIPGVIEARVHLALGERNALGQLTTPASASVLVRYDSDLLSQAFSENIRHLVTNSVAGLSYDRVSVTMVPLDLAGSAGGQVPRATMAAFAETSVLDEVTRILKFGLLAVGGAYLLMRLVRGRA